MNRISLFAVATVALMSSAHGGVILFDNLADPLIGNRPISPTSEYQSFSNGASADTLVDVKLTLQGNNTDGHSFSVDLYSSNAGPVPGSLLANVGTLLDSALPGSGSSTFDFPVSIALAASTRYWIGLSTTNGSDASWELALSSVGDTGVSGQFIDDTGIVGNTNFDAFAMQVSETALVTGTPEPATCVLGLSGLLAVAFLRRRQTHTGVEESRRGTHGCVRHTNALATSLRAPQRLLP